MVVGKLKEWRLIKNYTPTPLQHIQRNDFELSFRASLKRDLTMNIKTCIGEYRDLYNNEGHYEDMIGVIIKIMVESMNDITDEFEEKFQLILHLKANPLFLSAEMIEPIC